MLVKKLFLCGITGYPPPTDGDPRPPHIRERAGRVIAKTAIQTVPVVPWEYREDAKEVVIEFRERGIQIVALEQTDESLDYTKAPYRFPICLIWGESEQGRIASCISPCLLPKLEEGGIWLAMLRRVWLPKVSCFRF